MATHEIALGLQYLFSILSVDSTLTSLAPGGVWQGLAPPGTVPPFVVTVHMAGADVVNFGGGRAYADMTFQVKCVGPIRDLDTIMQAAARIDTLITLATQQVVTGGVILACFRIQPLSIDELVDGENWNSTGGLYQLMAKAT